MTVTASAPTRIDLAGGTIDIWPLYLFHPGAQTLNAAISLRARVTIEARDRRSASRSSSDDLTLSSGPLAYDALCADDDAAAAGASSRTPSGVRGVTLTTGSEVAGRRRHCRLVGAQHRGLRARWPDGPAARSTDDALLEIAMNVEAQAISVPTGLQDYRPALYGGIAAIELGVHGAARVRCRVDAAEL